MINIMVYHLSAASDFGTSFAYVYVSDCTIPCCLCGDGSGCLSVNVFSHELLLPCSISTVHNDLQSLINCFCSNTEPGVPYTVTVRASTAIGIGEPVSIVVFSMQQGKC